MSACVEPPIFVALLLAGLVFLPLLLVFCWPVCRGGQYLTLFEYIWLCGDTWCVQQWWAFFHANFPFYLLCELHGGGQWMGAVREGYVRSGVCLVFVLPHFQSPLLLPLLYLAILGCYLARSLLWLAMSVCALEICILVGCVASTVFGCKFGIMLTHYSCGFLPICCLLCMPYEWCCIRIVVLWF